MENCNLQELKGKNWMAAMAWCWFLGSFGAHRFYTGRQNTAWVMFALSLLVLSPVMWIWSVVDGFMLALGKYTHEDGSALYERIDWVGYLYIASVVLTILAVIGIMIFYVAVIAAVMHGVSGAAGSSLTPTVTP